MRSVRRIAQHDLGQAFAARSVEFGPGIGVIHLRFAVIGQGRCAHHPVEPAIERQGEVAIVLGHGIDRECRRGQGETVALQLAIGIVEPDAQALFLADLDQQGFLACIGRPGQRLGRDLRFDQGKLEALVEQLLAIEVEIDDPAAQQHQRQHVHEQDAAGKREAPRPARFFRRRIGARPVPQDIAARRIGHGSVSFRRNCSPRRKAYRWRKTADRRCGTCAACA